MKLKAIKYLLPTTDGRLHKEIEYLISLHENKMNKGKLENRISDLEHQFKHLEHNYREACLEWSDRDNEISISNSQGTEIKHPNDGGVELFKQYHQSGLHSIESTQELFKNDNTPQFKKFNEGDKIVCIKERKNFYDIGDQYIVMKDGSVQLKDRLFNFPRTEHFELIQPNQPLTIEQLKEKDVLVYEGSQYAFFTKGKEYEVSENRHKHIFLKNDIGGFLRLETIDLSQFTLKAKPSEEPTPDPITSTTLKTPNEWLKLMSEDERTQWWVNRELAYGWKIDMYKEYTFEDMIMCSFHWLSTPQGSGYWENLSNRYNN